MSNLDPQPVEVACGGSLGTAPALLAGHDVLVGRYTTVRRLLPQRERRMIGAWCFADQFGPDDVGAGPGMQVAPHPHCGLQTVSWLLEGEILHRDSVGSLQTILPGQLNLMTSGRGIAHSEESPPDHPRLLQGLQLWVALPSGVRDGAARFDHHPVLPTFREAGATITVVAGEMGGERSPAQVHTPLVGAEISLGTAATLPLKPSFEYGVLALTGQATVDGVSLTPGSLLYLGCDRSSLTLASETGARLFLLGGEPFEESLVMWWNFVARSHEEIVEAREDWLAERRFGEVHGYPGDRLPAPTLPTTRLKPRTRHGASDPA